MILDKHWWKTTDGRLVPDGDPDARILAYPRGHEVPDHLAEKVGLAAAVKQAAQPANKMTGKSEDKAVGKRPPTSGPGSGVDAWRQHAAETLGEPVESFADMSRDEIVELLDSTRDQ